MKTVSVDVYEFNELEEPIKQKLFERYRNVLVSDTWWSDSTIDFWKEKLEDMGFMDTKIYFSGFYSQGDGACFDASLNLKRLLSDTPKFQKIDFDNLAVNIETINYNYSHEFCKKVVVNRSISKLDQEEEIYEELVDYLENIRVGLCREIYKDLEKDYDYQTSNIAIAEFLEINQFEFLKDGTEFKRV